MREQIAVTVIAMVDAGVLHHLLDEIPAGRGRCVQGLLIHRQAVP